MSSISLARSLASFLHFNDFFFSSLLYSTKSGKTESPSVPKKAVPENNINRRRQMLNVCFQEVVSTDQSSHAKFNQEFWNAPITIGSRTTKKAFGGDIFWSFGLFLGFFPESTCPPVFCFLSCRGSQDSRCQSHICMLLFTKNNIFFLPSLAFWSETGVCGQSIPRSVANGLKNVNSCKPTFSV